jgi:hypothetical protein
MRRRLACALSGAILLVAPLVMGPSPALAQNLEAAVLAEVNFARAHPAEFAQALERAADADDHAGASARFAYEDPAAFDEAIDFLLAQAPLPPLKSDARLVAAAQDYAAAQGPRGDVGHGGPGRESLGGRLQARGVWAGLAAEDISYGYETAQQVVRQLIVDSGVPNRGHRNNIFGKSFQIAGVACGGHRVWGSMCVIDFAGALPVR